MDKIKQIFCKVLGADESTVNDETSYNSFEPWDSLKHLEIVSKLEEEFGIEFEMDDIIAMETFGKIRQITQKYLDKKATLK
jgi:acyl carrier protein